MTQTIRGAVLYGPRDVRFEERESPKIVEPTDAIIRAMDKRREIKTLLRPYGDWPRAAGINYQEDPL